MARLLLQLAPQHAELPERRRRWADAPWWASGDLERAALCAAVEILEALDQLLLLRPVKGSERWLRSRAWRSSGS